jgi:hypothetical protein
MLEKNIERHLVQRARENGGLAIKWVSPGFAGVPDRIVFLPGGRIILVELKAPGQKPTVLQNMVHGILRGLGADVRVIDSKEQVDGIFTETGASPGPGPDAGQPVPVDRVEDGWW